MMTETVGVTLEQIHKELDGQCQKCSQRCDKRVVSVVDSLMLCPDCAAGKERPVFTIKDKELLLCIKLTGWQKEQSEQFLQHMPLGLVLVKYNENIRVYWNFDKKSPIHKILSDHAGIIYKIQFHTKVVGKRKKSILVKGQRMLIVQKAHMKIKKIHISEKYKPSTPMEYKITRNLDIYKEHKRFHSRIIVNRENHSESEPFTLLDGYTAYIAAKELGVKIVDVVEVESKLG